MRDNIITGLFLVGALVFVIIAIKGIAGAPLSVWMFR